jgi:sugar O-acyltransferase (sialic acid O-acetyltransferase NeuD family)
MPGHPPSRFAGDAARSGPERRPSRLGPVSDGERLVLLGGGGLAREAAEAVHAANTVGLRWRLHGVLDDAPSMIGASVGGVPVLGPVDAASSLPSGTRLLATVGSSADPQRRRRLVSRVRVGPDRWAVLVHPSAQLARSTEIGAGSIVLALCVATADVRIGAHVVLMPGCILTHDDVIGDGATFASGVRLSGGVTVGEDAYLGTGSLVREGLTIGAGAVVGMGAVVTKDVPEGEVWAGVPARPLPRATPPV